MVTFDPHATRLSATEWAARPEWASVERRTADRVERFGELVVFAAHPDDETLGVGGLLAAAAQSRVPTRVVVATGDAARQRELEDALTALGLPGSATFLDLTDGALKHETDALHEAVETTLASPASGERLILAPWPGDRHGDHRTLGREVAAVAAERGENVAFYPIWLWQWGEASDVPWERLIEVELPPYARARKRTAIHSFASQLHGPSRPEGVLSEQFVERAGNGPEVLIRPEDSLVRHFERLHEDDADPWATRTRWYERRKRALLVAALPRERYESAFELGCSSGEVSAALAERCDAVLSVDAATAAVSRARERTAGLPGVTVQQARVPDAWPAGRFDLIVVSELAYYLAADQWLATIERCRDSLAPGGHVLLCHWTGAADDFAQSGAEAHAAFWRHSGLAPVVELRDESFLLEVFG